MATSHEDKFSIIDKGRTFSELTVLQEKSGKNSLPRKLFRLEIVKIEMLKKIKKADIWQFLRFCVVGTSNAVIDFGVLNLLLWLYPTTNLWRTLGYNSIAVVLASTNSFFWNKYWTFQQRNPINRQEIYRFAVIAGGTTFMNDTLMWLLGKIFPNIMTSSLIGANALKLAAIVGTMSISFFGMRLWVFFQKRFAGEAEALIEYSTDKLLAIEASAADDKAPVGLEL